MTIRRFARARARLNTNSKVASSCGALIDARDTEREVNPSRNRDLDTSRRRPGHRRANALGSRAAFVSTCLSLARNEYRATHRARYTHANTWPRAMQRMHGGRSSRGNPRLSHAYAQRARARTRIRAREKETEIGEKTAGKGGCSTTRRGWMGG